MKKLHRWLLATAGSAIAGTAWATFVLSQSASVSEFDTSYRGENLYDEAGSVIASVGDVNGDGLSDLVVGVAKAQAASGSKAGKVYLIFGRGASFTDWQRGISLAQADVVLTGERAGDELGTAVAALGDVNKDGRPDFAVSARFYDNGFDSGAGKAYILFGRPSSSPWPKLADVNTIADASYVGNVNEGAGYALSGAGDVNKDGINDILLGSFRYDYNVSETEKYSYAGRAFLLLGRQTGWSKGGKLETLASASFVGETSSQLVGRAVAGGGDLNADGYADLVIGAPGDVGTTTQQGQVGIIFGKPSGWSLGQRFSIAIGASYLGEAAGNNAGQACLVAGDVTADGYADLVVSAPAYSGSSSLPYNGKVYLITGRGTAGWSKGASLATATASWTGEMRTDQAGGTLALAGTFNDDAIPDFMIGAPAADVYDAAASRTYENAGKAYIIFGRLSWTAQGRLADADVIINGRNANSAVGAGLAGNFDIDGDLTKDIAVGAPIETVDGVTQSGAVYILRGALLQDEDGDGFSPLGGDCDDEDADSNPDGLETPYDGVDQDCDGEDLSDVDGDGYSSVQVVGGTDCEDNDRTIYPGALETCNGKDDNCSGVADEGVKSTFYRDQDGDGYGASSQSSLACTQPPGYVSNSTDCDDTQATIHPGADDIPYDGIDQDCSGRDNADLDGDGFDAISAGGQDCDDRQSAINPAAEEIAYDGIDQDCDGEDLYDLDGDGFKALPEGPDCNDSSAAINPTATDLPYDGIDQNCDGKDLTDVDQDGQDAIEVDGLDCDDSDPETFTGAADLVGDPKDQNCNGFAARDVDGDGHPLDSSDPLPGSANDCNDDDPSVYPGAEEVPYDGIDQDCDGGDIGDADLDGHFALDVPGGDDCDDEDATIYPDAPEIAYDEIDQDCDGEDLTDVDGDGYDSIEVAGGDDCNDDDASIHPGAPEISGNAVDENCDEVLSDADNDNYDAPADCDDADPERNPAATEIPYDGVDQDCDKVDLTDVDGDGFNGGEEGAGAPDCDDEDPDIYPGAPEFEGDGIDSDCDGEIDPPEDVDGDGFTAEQGDCDDGNAAVGPEAPELPGDELDNDCDGRRDERVVKGEQDPDGGCSCSSGSSSFGEGTLSYLLLLGFPLWRVGRRARGRLKD